MLRDGRAMIERCPKAVVLATFALTGVFFGPTQAAERSASSLQVTAQYGVYWAGFHFGDVQLVMEVHGSDYDMKGTGRFSVLGGLIYDWRGSTASEGKIGHSGPKPSLYTLSYSGGDKKGARRIEFADGAVARVAISPKKKPNPRNIPVTKQELRGVLDPMSGAFMRARPNLPPADLRVCNETIPVFEGKLRFDIVLSPKEQRRVESESPDGYSGLTAVCGVKFVPIAGYRPNDPAIKYMTANTGAIEAWLAPLPNTAFYLPYRVSVPTAFGSAFGQLTSFQIERN
jgi:hypothetical protein